MTCGARAYSPVVQKNSWILDEQHRNKCVTGGSLKSKNDVTSVAPTPLWVETACVRGVCGGGVADSVALGVAQDFDPDLASASRRVRSRGVGLGDGRWGRKGAGLDARCGVVWKQTFNGGKVEKRKPRRWGFQKREFSSSVADVFFFGGKFESMNLIDIHETCLER